MQRVGAMTQLSCLGRILRPTQIIPRISQTGFLIRRDWETRYTADGDMTQFLFLGVNRPDSWGGMSPHLRTQIRQPCIPCSILFRLHHQFGSASEQSCLWDYHSGTAKYKLGLPTCWLLQATSHFSVTITFLVVEPAPQIPV